MASTRYSQQPLQVYQDPVTPFENPSVRSAQGTSRTTPLQPIKDSASRRNVMLKPPPTGTGKQSPSKSTQQLSPSHARVALGNKLRNILMPPPGRPTHNTDSMEKKQPMIQRSKPQKALFTTFISTRPMGKENNPQLIYPAPAKPHCDISGAHLSVEGLYGQEPRLDRTLLEAAPIQDSRLRDLSSGDIQGSETGHGALPPPDSFPSVQDDGTKPPHSYAQLIGMSILRSPNRRLTLAQIYKWISDNYTFYSASDAGWQNSIRHNLSLNKAFIKQERPKDDPGKGNYWAIEAGMEHQFVKEKPVRRPAGINEHVPVMGTTIPPAFHGGPSSHFYKHLMTARQELPAPTTYALPEPQPPSIAELSSDATIPASDAVHQEELLQEQVPSSPLMQSSPPAGMMNSSPPVACHIQRRSDTPPPVPRFPSSSRTRSHKRNFASMDDSGYFSSLDSSALRPRRLPSDPDHPRLKRGRAEEEIARIRGSSYESPTRRVSFAAASSSPLRRGVTNFNSLMLPPVTPVVKLKARVRAPPSASPNTNLRLHRERVRTLVGSPLRGVACLHESTPWSPAFNIDETPSLDSQDADFDLFSNLLTLPPGSSPEKRSVKRPRLDRSRSANILADITNSTSRQSVTSTPSFSFIGNLDPSLFESPSKLLRNESPLRAAADFIDNFHAAPGEFLGKEFLVDDMDDFSGMDIMQGFRKIGAGLQSGRNPSRSSPSRPAFGRSCTSRF